MSTITLQRLANTNRTFKIKTDAATGNNKYGISNEQLQANSDKKCKIFIEWENFVYQPRKRIESKNESKKEMHNFELKSETVI